MAADSGVKLIGAFVTLIVGLMFIASIATQTNSATSQTNVINETYNLSVLGCVTGAGQINSSLAACNITVANVPTTWKITDCPLSSVNVHNVTGGQSFTAATDYNLFASSGIIQMLNTTTTASSHANTTKVDYTYCQDSYLNSDFGRSSVNLIPGFFAIALLLTSVGLFLSVAKDEGIL